MRVHHVIAQDTNKQPRERSSSETDFADSRATREHDRVNEYVRKAVLTVPQTAIFHFYHLRTRDSLKKGWVALMCTSDCSILRVLPPPSIIRS